jgi:antitoxin HigA-1
MARTPIHPGEHLAEELKELSISAAELARQIDVPVNRVTGIINGQRAITADTALRLGHWFGTSSEFWLNLQMLYELRLGARRSWRPCGKASQAHDPQAQQSPTSRVIPRNSCKGAPVTAAQRPVARAAIPR